MVGGGGGGGRSGRRRGRTHPVLPSSAAARGSEHSISCWYCDCKIYVFNNILFNLGWKYARYMKVWFSLGVYFSVCALVLVSMMLLWDSVGAFYFGGGSYSLWLQNLLASGFSISVVDTTIIVASTMLSIGYHEFGHAIAAASEGLQIEYVAIFLAVLFPGALVALNHDLLQNLPPFSMLRIYCAGIWHNITLCAVFVLTTLLLPLVLYPFYIHGEGLMVMGVSQTSPLLGYLSSYDVIVSMDGLNITRTDEWIKMLAQDNAGRTSNPDSLEGSQSYGATSSGKGYRVPNSWMEASKNLWQINGNLSCPDELIAFERTSCNGSTILSVSTGAGSDKEAEDRYCLIAKDVVKLKKCGTGWQRNKTDGNNCICSKDEYCMVPALSPGVSWIEISYTRPYSLECLQLKGNSSSVDATNNSLGPSPCGGTFVYVGDLLSAAHSVKLSSYRPRWMLLLFTAYVPYILENTFGCLFRVSAALAVVNCLPVYFLDGEAILETILCYIPWFIRRQRHKIFEVCRFLWTVLSVITFSRILYSVTLDFGDV